MGQTVAVSDSSAPGSSFADFAGTIGRTYADSVPWFPTRARPKGAPNVVVVLLDDVGFAQLGPFGSDIATPTLDRIAAEGLRYQRFHVTALCSPSRASLLTGRNHHAVGMGFLCDMPTGFPGYSCRIPRSAATMARVMRDAGYSTYAVGKWHLTPRNDRSASGPFETWPLGQGFERYYGFLHGDANHWTPTLVADNHQIAPPRRPEDGYHLTEDLVDQALAMIHDQHHATPDKPFLLYFAPGAMHAPHQVPREWAERYRGAFDGGWERWRADAFARQVASGIVPPDTVLSERPAWIDDWDSLGADERRLYARFQEVFAGFMTHFDHHLGRLVAGLERLGVYDDTLLMIMSDNGASAEGGRHGSINEHRFGFGFPEVLDDNLAALDDLGGFRAYNHYPWGWAWAGNAPFRLWKRYTWLGGTRTPLIVRYPRGVTSPGGVRPQLCHIIDVMPTVLEACGITPPETVDGVAQQPIDGASLVPSFTDPEAPDPRDTQYFEMLGSRSIYHAGWKATTDHISQGVLDEAVIPGSRAIADDRWSLFDMRTDFAEAIDVADEHPDVVAELEQRWEAEAARNMVLPISDGLHERIMSMEQPLWPRHGVARFYPGFGAIADEMVPSMTAGAALVATVEVPDGGAEGVLCAMGDWTNGFALVVADGRPTWFVNVVGREYRIVADDALTPGAHRVAARFEGPFGEPGEGVLYVDGIVAARAPLPEGLGAGGLQIGGGGLHLGHDEGFPVSDAYQVPFAFTGVLHHVEFGAEVALDARAEAEWRHALRTE